MKRRLVLLAPPLLLLPPFLAALVGALLAPGVLHPARRPVSSTAVGRADQMLARVQASRTEMIVTSADGTILRGWRVTPARPNGDWVELFHGVSDNRAGMLGHAELLLRSGYGIVMMDARNHGASSGGIATFGWLERNDTQAISDALFQTAKPHCLFFLGESMGASIALQSAAVDPRIDGVVAESPFADLREVSYEYAGLHLSSWLGRTLFRPAVSVAIGRVEKEGGFLANDVSPIKAVARRACPVLLICGSEDRTIPLRHSTVIFNAACGPKELWCVPGAGHSAALGAAPAEFERRVTTFFQRIHQRRKST
ncbi:MAG: alpha/beta fold hydrolase [Acidobacteria bacterium]|nr:alpha/beta fold hydrolase [Acidobacteriota bacterium]